MNLRILEEKNAEMTERNKRLEKGNGALEREREHMLEEIKALQQRKTAVEQEVKDLTIKDLVRRGEKTRKEDVDYTTSQGTKSTTAEAERPPRSPTIPATPPHQRTIPPQTPSNHNHTSNNSPRRRKAPLSPKHNARLSLADLYRSTPSKRPRYPLQPLQLPNVRQPLFSPLSPSGSPPSKKRRASTDDEWEELDEPRQDLIERFFEEVGGDVGGEVEDMEEHEGAVRLVLVGNDKSKHTVLVLKEVAFPPTFHDIRREDLRSGGKQVMQAAAANTEHYNSPTAPTQGYISFSNVC